MAAHRLDAGLTNSSAVVDDGWTAIVPDLGDRAVEREIEGLGRIRVGLRVHALT